MAKSELLSVRVEQETADRIQELIDREGEKEPDSLSELDKTGEPQVLRKIVREGLDVVAGGESDVRRLRDRIEELEADVDRLEEVKTDPTVGDWVEVTRAAPPPVRLFLYPLGVSAGGFAAAAIAVEIARYVRVGAIHAVAEVLIGVSFTAVLLAVIAPVAFVIGRRIANVLGS